MKINLSKHADKYASNSLELDITKKVNFIYGKNGTGKTTIADEIADQLSSQYAVHVFKDFDGVAINERLDAVALGTENAGIQKQIDNIDKEIIEISKELEQPEDKTSNLFTKARDAKKALDAQNKKIDDFYKRSAQVIKNQSNPQIAKTSYDLNDFKSEISNAELLTDEEVKANKNTVSADKKADVLGATLPVVDLASYLTSTNEVLESSVKQPGSIPELKGNPEKQQFARSGMDVHKHKQGEVCAFCGNEIDEDRWKVLAEYFNNEVNQLEQRILAGTTMIQKELATVDEVVDIDERVFYGKYADRIKQLNVKIQLRKSECKNFLSSLEKALEGKSKNLFTETEAITIDVPDNFSEVQKEYTKLINENNNFSKNLAIEQEKAKSALRYHEIQKKLDTFKYTEASARYNTLSQTSDTVQKELDAKKQELTGKQDERLNLIAKTKDEEKIAVKISKLLKSMGVSSFELKLVTDGDEEQKGQYQIVGHDGILRPVTALSKGEENIIAFLYFMFSLDSTDRTDTRSRIIVLDDPMTSNDDTMQYIMIGEVQKLCKGMQNDYFVLLTHNVHFYLNVRPYTGYSYKKYGTYHLLSDGKLSTIRTIENEKDDFKTSYETLWKELVFLYGASGATADLLLNPSRRICDTYMNFTKKDAEAFYGENTNAKKLFDVNQHSIDDLEADQNAKTKEEIKDILYGLFKQNNAEDHFNSYWKENE